MLRKNRASKFSFLPGILRLAILTILIDMAWIAISQAQDKCNEVLTDARSKYEDGHFIQAINLLTPCLADEIPKDQRIKAYHLLSLSYFREDYQDSAKQAIEKLFDLDRNFKPDADDPKDYQEIVEKVRKDLPVSCKEKIFGGKKKWFWRGGILVAFTVVVKELLQPQPPKEAPLPAPPNLPRDP